MSLDYFKFLNVFRKGNPRYVVFFVTSCCNARCVFCHYWKQVEDAESKHNELTVEEIERIAKKYGDIVKLEIAGGEPFSRNDLHQIIDVCNTGMHPIIIDIPTNGILTDRVVTQTHQILKKSKNIIEIQLSFHGDEELHDSVVGVPGAFKNLLRTEKELENLRKNYGRLKIKLNLVYFSGNVSRIHKLLEFTEKNMILDRFFISYPHGSAKSIDLYEGIRDYRKYCELSSDIYKNFKIADKTDLHTLLFRAIKSVMDDEFVPIMEERCLGAYCRATQKMIVIGETGTVFPCEGKWVPLGNLRDFDYDMARLLSAPTTFKFRKENLGPHKCHCSWGNAVACGIVHNPKYYPQIVLNLLGSLLRT